MGIYYRLFFVVTKKNRYFFIEIWLFGDRYLVVMQYIFILVKMWAFTTHSFVVNQNRYLFIEIWFHDLYSIEVTELLLYGLGLCRGK